MALRKITDLINVASVKDTDLLIVETDNGTRSIKKNNLIDAVDNCNSDSIVKPLSANQGRILKNHCNDLTAEVEVERQRINQFTKLGEGSTTGDAELMDLRVGADGITYNSAGNAIRTNINNLPKVNDNEVSESDTWSSYKINEGFDNVATRWKLPVKSKFAVYKSNMQYTLNVNGTRATAQLSCKDDPSLWQFAILSYNLGTIEECQGKKILIRALAEDYTDNGALLHQFALSHADHAWVNTVPLKKSTEPYIIDVGEQLVKNKFFETYNGSVFLICGIEATLSTGNSTSIIDDLEIGFEVMELNDNYVIDEYTSKIDTEIANVDVTDKVLKSGLIKTYATKVVASDVSVADIDSITDEHNLSHITLTLSKAGCVGNWFRIAMAEECSKINKVWIKAKSNIKTNDAFIGIGKDFVWNYIDKVYITNTDDFVYYELKPLDKASDLNIYVGLYGKESTMDIEYQYFIEYDNANKFVCADLSRKAYEANESKMALETMVGLSNYTMSTHAHYVTTYEFLDKNSSYLHKAYNIGDMPEVGYEITTSTLGKLGELKGKRLYIESESVLSGCDLFIALSYHSSGHWGDYNVQTISIISKPEVKNYKCINDLYEFISESNKFSSLTDENYIYLTIATRSTSVANLSLASADIKFFASMADNNNKVYDTRLLGVDINKLIEDANKVDKLAEDVDMLAESVDKLDELSTKNYIVCWGDSLTAQGGWTTRLQNLSGLTVYNAGIGGENVRTIMARQGADIMIVDSLTIPADALPVQIAKYSDGGIPTQFGYKVTPLLQGGTGCVNPVKIGDIEGTLTWTGSSYSDTTGAWTFTRSEAGEEFVIDRPTAIVTGYDRNRNNPYLMVIFMGQNGGYSDIDDLVQKHKLMISHAKAKNVIVLGLASGSAEDRAEYEAAMKKEFGRYFISLREYLAHPIYDADGNIISCYGLADQGLEPSSVDYNGTTYIALDEIATGTVPHQILSDNVHFKSSTRTVIGNMIYKKCCELGIF